MSTSTNRYCSSEWNVMPELFGESLTVFPHETIKFKVEVPKEQCKPMPTLINTFDEDDILYDVNERESHVLDFSKFPKLIQLSKKAQAAYHFDKYILQIHSKKDSSQMAYIVLDHKTHEILTYLHESYCYLQLGDAETVVVTAIDKNGDNVLYLANYGDVESTVMIKY